MKTKEEKTVRFTPEFSIEERAKKEGEKDFVIRGYAALYDTPSEAAGWYTEVISKGAFKDAVGVSDIRALFNHNDSQILGRQKPGAESNTLKVWEDEKGLAFELELPKSQVQLKEAIERKDINQNSFAFTVAEEEWTEKTVGEEVHLTRKIEKVDQIYDISPVTYPFYEEASFTYEQRMYKEFKDKKKPEEKQKKLFDEVTFKIESKKEDIEPETETKEKEFKAAIARLALGRYRLLNINI